MKRKRIVSMLLVATMAATLFAGCGNDSGKKGGTETGAPEVRKSLMHSLLYRDLKSMMIMKSRRSSRKRQV